MYYLIIQNPWFWIQFQNHLWISNCVVIRIAVVRSYACLIQLWSPRNQWIWVIYWSEWRLQLWSCHVRTPYWAETIWQVRKMCFALGGRDFNWPLTLLSFLGKFMRFLYTYLFSSLKYCSSRPRREQHLVRWASSQLHDINTLSRMVDPSIGGKYSEKSLSRFADIISRCIQVKFCLFLLGHPQSQAWM